MPPGIARLPGPGQYYASPALSRLLRSVPAAELGARFPGRQIGTIGPAALPSPDSLLVIVGHRARQLAHQPGAVRVTSIVTVPPSSCNGPNCLIGVGIDSNGIDLVLSAVAAGLLFPVLIFIGTASRLSAARREQRFAAMRLAGATPRQISVISAVESAVAAVAGAVGGFALFYDPAGLFGGTPRRFRSSGAPVVHDLLCGRLALRVAPCLAAEWCGHVDAAAALARCSRAHGEDGAFVVPAGEPGDADPR